jgi:hypothetical protein
MFHHSELGLDGDFRNIELKHYVKDADIIVTNPPFSLFRDFIDLMMTYEKKFLIVGPLPPLGYKNIFPLMKDYKM